MQDDERQVAIVPATATCRELHAALGQLIAKEFGPGVAHNGGAFWVKRSTSGRGDFTSNALLVLAAAGIAPSEVARLLAMHLNWPGTIEEANGFFIFV